MSFPLAWLLFWAWGLLGTHAVQLMQRSRTSPSLAVAGGGAGYRPYPTLTPLQFLLVSSPAERKVGYIQMRNFQGANAEISALVDSGLGAPHGIAFDRQRGDLYVTDTVARKIFRFGVMVQEGDDGSYSLVTDGDRLTVVENKLSRWVAVDNSGDLYFTDDEANSVNKITADVMDQIAQGIFQGRDLVTVSESILESEAAAAASSELAAGATTTEAPSPEPRILAFYEAAANPHVALPGGILTDSISLYWANGANAGSVVQGSTHPEAPVGLAHGARAASFETTVVANSTGPVFGVSKTHNLIIYTSGGSVYGVSRNGGDPIAFTNGLEQPRGLVWDGDSTIFVADQAGNTVYSLPCGRLSESMPLAHAFDFNDVFGLALLEGTDPAFEIRAGAEHRAPARWLTAVLLPVALAKSFAFWASAL